MDTYGGLSVSDVVARHTGERPIFDSQVSDGGTPKAPPHKPPVPRRPAPKPPRTQAPPTGPAPVRRPAQPPRANESDAHALPTPPPADAKPPKPRQPRRVAAEPTDQDAPARRRPATEKGQRPPRRPAQPGRVPPRSALDPMTMTDQMEAIDDATKVRHKIDDTLARFSAAHDEMNAVEAKRKERLERFTTRPAALLEQTRTALMRVVVPSSSEPEATASSEDSEPSVHTRLQEKKQRRNQRSLVIGRIVAAVLAALVFLGTGAAWASKTWFNNKFTEVAALSTHSAHIQNAAGQTGGGNVLVIGSDTRNGASATTGSAARPAFPVPAQTP
jgi:hypothetical protein